MSYINSTRKSDLESDLAAILAHIAAIDAAMATGATSGTISYSFDSGTGRQQEVFTSPLILVKTRAGLVATRDKIRRELAGRSIMTQQARR